MCPFSFSVLSEESSSTERYLDVLPAHKQGQSDFLGAVSLGERLSSSEFGLVFEAPAPCGDCLNFSSVNSSGRVECSGDPAERSPGSEECLAYVPVDAAVASIDRSRELDKVSEKAAVNLRRSIGHESPVLKECGCRVCGVLLTEENWYSVHRRRRSRICKPCHKKYQAEQRKKYRSIGSKESHNLSVPQL